MDIWQGDLYDMIYRSPIAVDAMLESSAGVTASIRVCDETKGTAIAGGPGQAESVRPTCRVRANEILANGIAFADLPDSSVTFNGQTWRVKATQIQPSPAGESAGEIMLILLNDGG